jgi:hypothetical protein
MNEPRVDVVQLLRRDPQAWTALLSGAEGLEDVVVTAVTAQPIQRKRSLLDKSPRVTRYLIGLANHSDPVTLIGKETNEMEALFYRDLAPSLPYVVPRCWLTHIADERGFVVLDDVPNHVARQDWSAEDVEDVIDDMAAFHATYLEQPGFRAEYPWLRHFIDREQRTYDWPELRASHTPFFEEGPGAIISDHSLSHVGRLAPRFLEAANGLVVMRALGGWPGVMGESHLAAAADLLDDPVPMLDPLQRLPDTLLHGDMHSYHWHITLFEERRLLDWSSVTLGPGILDLVSLQEQFDLLLTDDDPPSLYVRQQSPVSEETMIDSYMLAMKANMGSRFNSREARRAIAAARCLHVLTNWFPYFATWFDQMPDVYTWQRINRLAEDVLVDPSLQPLVGYRPYLKRVFRRFLQAYRTL